MSCTCGAPGEFATCCGPILAGERLARTAEELMRSRFSAYVRCDAHWLLASLAPSERGGFDRQGAEEWARQAKWDRLEVLRTERGGPGDADGVVEFIARYAIQDQPVEHHEVASFRKEDGRWYFVDGVTPSAVPYRRPSPKVGANDPCPCGSGRKFKKCCGKVA
jgi:SEC-C motif-containing protein